MVQSAFVEDATLLAELAPAAERLLERHLAAVRTWYPHELVPWSRGRDFEPGEQIDEASSGLPPGVRSALIVNLLTEDNLPYYLAGLVAQFGEEHPWGAWVRRWTAEEMRHASVIRDYLAVTRCIDLRSLEQARMQHVSTASVPRPPTAPQALVYVALQELAARISHRNTGRQLDDPRGNEIMARVSADENLHYVFYRDVVSAALQCDPSAMVIAIDAQVRHFAMPGSAIPEFGAHLRMIAASRIYSAEIFHADVLVPVVLGHWGLEGIAGLSPDGARARDRTLRFIDRLGRIAPRLSNATA